MKCIIFSLLICAVSYGDIKYPEEFKIRDFKECTEKIKQPCVIKFIPIKSEESISFTPGYHEIGTLWVDINDSHAAKIDLYYKMLGNNIVFTMDSITQEKYREKGLNSLLRNHYIDFITKITIPNTTVYVGSQAISPISDHVLRKNGIQRVPELDQALINIFNTLETKEDDFKNKPTPEQVEIIKKKDKSLFFSYLQSLNNEKTSPWAHIYEKAYKAMKRQTDPLFQGLTHLKKVR